MAAVGEGEVRLEREVEVDQAGHSSHDDYPFLRTTRSLSMVERKEDFGGSDVKGHRVILSIITLSQNFYLFWWLCIVIFVFYNLKSLFHPS